MNIYFFFPNQLHQNITFFLFSHLIPSSRKKNEKTRGQCVRFIISHIRAGGTPCLINASGVSVHLPIRRWCVTRSVIASPSVLPRCVRQIEALFVLCPWCQLINKRVMTCHHSETLARTLQHLESRILVNWVCMKHRNFLRKCGLGQEDNKIVAFWDNLETKKLIKWMSHVVFIAVN